jgi:hypothetical protein
VPECIVIIISLCRDARHRFVTPNNLSLAPAGHILASVRKQTIFRALATFSAGLLLGATAGAQDNEKPEQYSAVWAVIGGTGSGTTVPFDVRINKYNTFDDIKAYADLVAKSGPPALRSALEKQDLGQLSPVGKVGTPIAIARKIVQGDKTIIHVVTVRNLSFVELRYSGRSVDYPYTILELILDKNGKGTGTAIAAARIKFNKKTGVHEIESLQHGTATNKLLNVQYVK